MRKINLKDSLVFTPDATLTEQLDAASFIGDTCLFSDDQEFGRYRQETLDRVDIGNTEFHYGAKNTPLSAVHLHTEYFGYMIPINHVVFTDTEESKDQQSKPKLRMLNSFDEFKELTGKGIGDTITIRSTDTELFDFTATCLVLGTATRNETEQVLIGNYSMELEELFDEYEWEDAHGTFKPFGVEE